MKRIVVLSFFVIASLMFVVPVMAANLIADGGSDGEKIDVGDVTVSNDGTYLIVTISTADGWEMLETHVAIVNSLTEIKMSKGGPKVGNLPLGEEFDPPATGPVSYSVSLENLGILIPNVSSVIVVVHAEVRIDTGEVDLETGEPIYRYESAWAQAEDVAGETTGQFDGSNWATYVTVVVPVPPIILPPAPGSSSTTPTTWGAIKAK